MSPATASTHGARACTIAGGNIVDAQIFTTTDGQALEVTRNATPFGATMSGEYVVWAEAVGRAESAVGRGLKAETAER